MDSVAENTTDLCKYEYIDNTNMPVQSTKIDTSNSNVVAKNTDVDITDTYNKVPLFKTKQDILNLYIKFNEKQSKILKELNKMPNGYTITDFKLKLISDKEAIDLLTQMRLIANNSV